MIAIATANGILSLDPEKGTLKKGDAVVAIRPKTFALLSYFAANPDRVIGKDELFAAVWNDVVVSDDALTQTVRDVRRVIGDDRSLLRSLPKRGYFFSPALNTNAYPIANDDDVSEMVAALRGSDRDSRPRATEGLQIADSAIADGMSAPRYSGRERPAITVLSFVSDSSVDQSVVTTAFVEGILRDVIRNLARLRSLFVIAANTSRLLKADASDPVPAGKMLQVDYVCSGTLSVTGDTLAVDYRLTAISDGRILLAERAERPLRVVAGTGHDIAEEIVKAVAAEVELTERNLAVRDTIPGFDAWRAHHAGMWHIHEFSVAGNERAAALFGLAVSIDPTFSRPYAGLSHTHFMRAFVLEPALRRAESQQAYDCAQRGVDVDPKDPLAYAALGRAQWQLGMLSEAAATLDHSIALSPNFALAHYTAGIVHCVSGEAGRGVQLGAQAIALSPFDPLLTPLMASRAVAHLALGQMDDAVRWAEETTRRTNADPHALRLAALVLAAGDEMGKATGLAEKINRESPHAGGERFYQALRFRPPDERVFRDLSRRIGLH
jgi:TolB-like protein/tetratricopeptide (TPR) repeat protein